MLATQNKDFGNILVTEIHGKFTQEKFNNTFKPHLEMLAESFSEVNVFLEFSDNLNAWSTLRLFKQFQKYKEPCNSINRLAIISDSYLLKWRLNLYKLNSNRPIKTFSRKDSEKAKAWLAIG